MSTCLHSCGSAKSENAQLGNPEHIQKLLQVTPSWRLGEEPRLSSHSLHAAVLVQTEVQSYDIGLQRRLVSQVQPLLPQLADGIPWRRHQGRVQHHYSTGKTSRPSLEGKTKIVFISWNTSNKYQVPPDTNSKYFPPQRPQAQGISGIPTNIILHVPWSSICYPPASSS